MILTTRNRNAYWQLMRANKPIGIYLLLWPTLWALFLSAQGAPSVSILLIFVAGVVVMRSAGCVINDYADRNVDGAVERTAQRPLATGAVTEKEALALFAVLIAVAFGLVLLLNWQTMLLSLVALCLAASYPFMKRFTHYPQVVLGAAFGWSIPMASMASIQSVPFHIWLLFMANLCWTVAYDSFYAMVDRDDDLKIGVKSTAIAFGQFDLFIIALLQLCTLGLLMIVFYMANLNVYAFIGLAVACTGFGIMLWQTRNREKGALFKAFLNNHYIGMIIWLSIVVGLL